MIADDHQVAYAERFVHAPGRIGQEQRVDAQHFHHADGIDDLLRGIAFIVMEPPGEDDHLFVIQPAKDQAALVAFYRRYGKMGNVPVRNFFFYFDLPGQVAQATAQNDAYPGRRRVNSPDKTNSLL